MIINLSYIVVTAAILLDRDKILIARRRKGKHPEFKWEFPGGKVNRDETEEEALKRELKEELGISIKDISSMGSYIYEYDAFGVELHPFLIKSYKGDPITNEKEQIVWVDIQDLNKVKIIPGSKLIVETLTNIFSIERS